MNDPNQGLRDLRESPNTGGPHERRLPDLKALIDGELSPATVWLVRAHLWVCPACREEVIWLKRLGEDMRDLEKATPSPLLRARILAALPEAAPGRPAILPRFSTGRPQLRRAFGALAAIGCFAFAAILISNRYILAGRETPDSAKPGPAHNPQDTASKVERGTTPRIAEKVTPKDAHSAMADSLLADWLRSQQHHEADRLHQNRTNWTDVLALVQSGRGSINGAEPVTLSLAVPSVDASRRLIVDWAKSIGGTVARNAHGGQSAHGVAPMVTTDEKSLPNIARTADPADRAIVLRIPAAKLASLERVLTQAGAWGPAKATTRTAMIVPGGAKDTVGARRDPPMVTGQAPTSVGVGTPHVVSKTGPSDQVMGRDGTFVTLRVELSAITE